MVVRDSRENFRRESVANLLGVSGDSVVGNSGQGLASSPPSACIGNDGEGHRALGPNH